MVKTPAAITQPPTFPGRAAGRALPPIPWRKLAVWALVIAALGVAIYRHSDMAAVHAAAARLPGALAFALLLVLPLTGFPASVLHIAAGIRFGIGPGLALVSLSILLQLLASFALARHFRLRFDRASWVRRLRDRVPPGTHGSVCVVALLLPGAPYAAINYALPLLGVPLRTYLMTAWPLHTLRSSLTVAFGDQSDELTPARLAVLLGYGLALAVASWLTYRRARARLEDPPPGASDPRPRA